MQDLREIRIKVKRDELRNISDPFSSQRHQRDDETLREIINFPGVEIVVEEVPQLYSRLL